MSNSTAVITSFSVSDDSTTFTQTTTTPTESTPSTVEVISSFVTTEGTTISSVAPESTNLITSTQIISNTNADGSVNTEPTTVVITSTRPATTIVNTQQQTRTTAAVVSTSSSPAALGNDNESGGGSGSSGLGTAGTTAIAVVIPVVVVAILVGLGIWFWRKRKSKKNAAEQRQKEMEDYSYNPNGDPTLPAIGSDAGGTQMAEDSSSGYRGWGAAGAMSNRKASTTLSAGNTRDLSASGSDPGMAYGGYPSSPNGNNSDGHSDNPLMHNQRSTMNSDELGELGTGPAAGAAAGGIRRGPSNASSAYSAGGRSDEDVPPMPGPPGQAYDYNPNIASGYAGYGQHGPYGDGSYGGNTQPGDMPVVRDVSARRNTQIRPGGSYQQGNSGIAQNF